MFVYNRKWYLVIFFPFEELEGDSFLVSAHFRLRFEKKQRALF